METIGAKGIIYCMLLYWVLCARQVVGNHVFRALYPGSVLHVNLITSIPICSLSSTINTKPQVRGMESAYPNELFNIIAQIETLPNDDHPAIHGVINVHITAL